LFVTPDSSGAPERGKPIRLDFPRELIQFHIGEAINSLPGEQTMPGQYTLPGQPILPRENSGSLPWSVKQPFLIIKLMIINLFSTSLGLPELQKTPKGEFSARRASGIQLNSLIIQLSAPLPLQL